MVGGADKSKAAVSNTGPDAVEKPVIDDNSKVTMFKCITTQNFRESLPVTKAQI
jgi:hypothetical protein